jgi:phage terminase small subunit
MLTPRQKMFAKHYVANGFNATQAAISAGYSKSGARVEGCRLLANPNIKKKWLNI